MMAQLQASIAARRSAIAGKEALQKKAAESFESEWSNDSD